MRRAVVLAAGPTVVLAASSGTGTGYGPHGPYPAGGGGYRGYGGMMGDFGGHGGMGGSPAGGGWAGIRGGMSLRVVPSSVTAGTVSFRGANDGLLIHELVVLPLGAGAGPGQRVIGSDGKAAETGSLGEASTTCAAGAGDGIAAGSYGWVTLNLKPGHYELVCNLPGHYTAGMYTQLNVTP